MREDLVADGAAAATERFEDIERKPEVRLHVSEGWSWCVLVCKDFLTPRTRWVLEELRVRLVLVPALSPKTHPFEAGAQSLEAFAQTFCVVANG